MAIEVTEMYAAQGGAWVPVAIGGGGTENALDQAAADVLYVNVTGDSMSGALVVPATPPDGSIGTGATVGTANPLQAATVAFVEQAVTVSTAEPTDTPARDGLMWVIVA